MLSRDINQFEFASILYDTLFGLILFFSLEAFLDINNPVHFVFYIFTNVIIIHWWLLFKAASDTFAETRRSALFIFFNIIYIIFLELMAMYAKLFDYVNCAFFLVLIIFVDLLWVFLVKYVHKWKTADYAGLQKIKKETNNIFKADLLMIVPLFVILALSPLLSPTVFVAFFIIIYLFYILLSFILKIIDLKII
jgi:hypothetical protein